MTPRAGAGPWAGPWAGPAAGPGRAGDSVVSAGAVVLLAVTKAPHANSFCPGLPASSYEAYDGNFGFFMCHTLYG